MKKVVRAILILLLLWLGYCTYSMFAVHGGELFSGEIDARIGKIAQGCTDGVAALRGESFNAWPGEFDSWYELELSANALVCIQKHLALNTSGCNPATGSLTKPPAWFHTGEQRVVYCRQIANPTKEVIAFGDLRLNRGAIY